MILDVLLTIYFFSMFIFLLYLGYKRRSESIQCFAFQSFIVGSMFLKKILSPNYTMTINVITSIVGLSLIVSLIHNNNKH